MYTYFFRDMNIKQIYRHVKANPLKLRFLGIGVIGFVLWGTYVTFQPKDMSHLADLNALAEREYKTTTAKKIKDKETFLIGKIISHERAQVYSRRIAIVEDILVDIGDAVSKGQVLAYLLPEGVEDASGLAIQEQADVMRQAKDGYENTEAVARAEVARLEEVLSEKELALTQLRLDAYGESKSNTLRLEEETRRVAVQELSLLQTQKAEALDVQISQLQLAENLVAQEADMIWSALQEVDLAAIQILSGRGTLPQVGYNSPISHNQVAYTLRVLDQQRLYTSVDQVNRYRSLLGSYDASVLYSLDDWDILLDQGHVVMDDLKDILFTSTQANVGDISIDTLASRLQKAQQGLYTAREAYEKAEDNRALIQKTTDQQIRVFDEKIATQKVKIELLEAEWDKKRQEVNSDEALLEAEIDRFRQDIALVEARLKQQIDAAKRQYELRNTQYQKVIAEKGHTAIRAPFAGTIAKRHITVGDIMRNNMPVFDMVDVQTSLSAQAKHEVQFGLPEAFQALLSVGDRIQFFLPNQPDELFHAEVTRMSPQVDDQLRTFTVQAKLPDDLSFAHETSVQVKLITAEQNAYRVDASLLKREDEENYLWVLEENKPVKRIVTVIAEDGEFAEVDGDINEETMLLEQYYGY